MVKDNDSCQNIIGCSYSRQCTQPHASFT